MAESGAVHYHGGIEWPLSDASSGRPSTTPTNKSVWISALEALVSEGADGGGKDGVIDEAKDLVRRFKSQPNREWRHGYIPLLHEFGRVMASCGSAGALVMARAGLDRLNSSMVVTTGGEEGAPADGGGPEGDEKAEAGGKVSAREAVLTDGAVRLRPTSTVAATAADDAPEPAKRYELASPHRDETTGENLPAAGDDMKAQLSAWAAYGCIEPSAAESAGKVADVEDCSSLVAGRAFVLLGATSAMGPAEVLIRMGATVAAVARPGSKMESLMEAARKGPRGTTLLAPELEGNGGRAGGDLIRDAPELARWVADLCPDRTLVICNLAYLDGEKNVRAGVGMDLITEYVCQKRKGVAISYIISPGTVHVIPEEAALDAKQRYDSAPFWHSLCGVRASNTWRESLPPDGLRLFNGLSSVQGPNYALTKTAQQWRAMAAYHASGDDSGGGGAGVGVGVVVSANLGPPTRTQSMVGHDKMAAALEGMQSFAPNVAFDVPCAKTLLAALMLRDANFPESAANPESSEEERRARRHPMCLFHENSAHGGVWRCPWEPESISVASFVSGKVGLKRAGWCPEEALGPRPSADTLG